MLYYSVHVDMRLTYTITQYLPIQYAEKGTVVGFNLTCTSFPHIRKYTLISSAVIPFIRADFVTSKPFSKLECSVVVRLSEIKK